MSKTYYLHCLKREGEVWFLTDKRVPIKAGGYPIICPNCFKRITKKPAMAKPRFIEKAGREVRLLICPDKCWEDKK